MKDFTTLESDIFSSEINGSQVVDGLCLRIGPTSSSARFFKVVREFQLLKDKEGEGEKEVEVWQPYVGRSYWDNSPNCSGQADNSVLTKLLYAAQGSYNTLNLSLQKLMILRVIPFKTCADVAGLSLKDVTERFEASEFSFTNWGADVSQTEIWERGRDFSLHYTTLRIPKRISFPNSGDEVEIKSDTGSDEKTRCVEFTEPETLTKHVLFFGSLEEVAVLDSKPVFDLEFPKSAPPRGTTTLIIIGSVVGGMLVLAALFFVGRHVVTHKNKEEKEKLSLRPV